jgi:hypothetical protein
VPFCDDNDRELQSKGKKEKTFRLLTDDVETKFRRTSMLAAVDVGTGCAASPRDHKF